MMQNGAKINKKAAKKMAKDESKELKAPSSALIEMIERD
jgi:hypothetical protein